MRPYVWATVGDWHWSFQCIGHTQEELSPFNITNDHTAPYFTKEEVVQLFQQFQNLCNVKLESGITERIHETTSGHPAMVCYCGKQVQQRGILSLKDWLAYEMFDLYQYVFIYMSS
jgi:hypothetical protein